MKSSQTASLLKSIHRNGFLETAWLSLQLLVVRLGFISSITKKGFGKINIRNKTSDTPVFRQIFMDGEYDFNFGKKPKVIVDLGANIGLFAMLMHKRHPDAKIFSLEPYLPNFNQLKLNLLDYPNVLPFHQAIWNENGFIEMNIDALGAEWASQANGFSKNKVSETCTSALTMENFMQKHGLETIDILKIDIEGSEKELFEGTCEWVKNVKCLIIELHDTMKAGTSITFFRKILLMNDFHFSIVGENLVFINKSI